MSIRKRHQLPSDKFRVCDVEPEVIWKSSTTPGLPPPFSPLIASPTQLFPVSDRFPEADIISRAYDCGVNWGHALSRHYVARNDVSYLEAVARHRGISVALVEDAIDASVDAPNSKATGEELERLSRLISMLNNVEVIATSAFTSSSSSASPPPLPPTDPIYTGMDRRDQFGVDES